MAGVTGKVHDRRQELLIAGNAEHDLLVLARPPGRWGRPSQAGQRLGVGEPAEVLAGQAPGLRVVPEMPAPGDAA
jgi:hypothetical protein